MIQLAKKNLSAASEKLLKELQSEINSESNFLKRASKAKSFWKSKASTKKKKECFEEIISTLKEMCVSIEVCNYCENNEANDIEHIHPKSFYPNLAFEWTNYLLACKQCNSGYKLDKCFTVNHDLSTSFIKRGTKPKTKSTVAFINPRVEDPNKFMLLDLGSQNLPATWKFIVHPKLSKLDQYKAAKSLEILRLNDRDTLIHARKNAARFYYDRIERLNRIMNSKSFEELKLNITPYEHAIDKSISLEKNIEKFKKGFKKSIQTHAHPSVWYSIKKIQSKIDDKWKKLFNAMPECLDW